MATTKRKRSESDSRHKRKHKNCIKSSVEDRGIKYLGHAGKDVNIVLGKNSSPGTINVCIHQDQRVSKLATIERADRRKREKEREKKRRKRESAKGQKKIQEKAANKAQKRIEKRRRKHIRNTGKEISLDDFKGLEKKIQTDTGKIKEEEER